MPNEFISIKQLAKELGMDRSHARRYVLKLGLEPQKRRTADSGNQLTLTLTDDEAQLVRNKRDEQGFLDSTKPVSRDAGVFYVIQLVPELDPHRIKLGFADDAATRLNQHRTSAPTARLLKTWPCRRTWETTVMDCLTATTCQLILNEVFECEDLDSLLKCGNAVFELLPDPNTRPALSASSPHKS